MENFHYSLVQWVNGYVSRWPKRFRRKQGILYIQLKWAEGPDEDGLKNSQRWRLLSVAIGKVVFHTGELIVEWRKRIATQQEWWPY